MLIKRFMCWIYRGAPITLLGLAFLFLDAATAQTFPTKPVRMITIQSPGSAVDIVARVLAEELGVLWSQKVVVENRVGASGLIAAEAAAKASPDGYTLFLSTSGVMSLNPHLYPKLPYDTLKDYHAIAHVANYPYLLLVNQNLPIGTLAELIRYSKAQPAPLTYGSVGPGSLSNIAAKLLAEQTGMNLTNVFYKTVAGALTDVAGARSSYSLILPDPRCPRSRGGGCASWQ